MKCGDGLPARLAVAQSTSAVTIYRIGGESIPQPELCSPRFYSFWSDVEPLATAGPISRNRPIYRSTAI